MNRFVLYLINDARILSSFRSLSLKTAPSGSARSKRLLPDCGGNKPPHRPQPPSKFVTITWLTQSIAVVIGCPLSAVIERICAKTSMSSFKTRLAYDSCKVQTSGRIPCVTAEIKSNQEATGPDALAIALCR